jgi:hypothetical protein
MIIENSVIASNKESMKEIYEILQKRDTNGNPLSSMMIRNIRVFAKINIILRKQLRGQLKTWQ